MSARFGSVYALSGCFVFVFSSGSYARVIPTGGSGVSSMGWFFYSDSRVLLKASVFSSTSEAGSAT